MQMWDQAEVNSDTIKIQRLDLPQGSSFLDECEKLNRECGEKLIRLKSEMVVQQECLEAIHAMLIKNYEKIKESKKRG